MADRIFKSKDKDGSEVVLKFAKPNQKLASQADLLYRQQFSLALRNGILTNAEAVQIMKENGTWTDEHEKQSAELRAKIRELEQRFDSPLEESEGYTLCNEVAKLREQLSELNGRFSSVTDNTAESMASEYRTQFFAANCVVYNNGSKKVFKDLEDFLNRVSEQVAIDAYREAMIANFEQALGISVSSDLTADLPEKRWLDSRIKVEEATEEANESQEEPKKRGRKKAQ